jgi:hypothetical protein
MNSFARANELASDMRIHASNFSAEQQCKILAGIKRNDQLRYANTVSSVIAALRNTKRLAPEEFESVLEKNGLQQFILDAGGEAKSF